MRRPPLPVLVVLLPLILAACDSDHPASLREAYFAYLDARAAGADAGEIEDALAGLGWNTDGLTSAVERLRSEDPEGFRGLINAYRAARGLPRDE
ncbi:hypothetical protein KAU45_05200 [bacterium]|nr:hypothetical protein [bacterium]